MPALSERDLLSVEKFSNAMKAALGRNSRQATLRDTDPQSTTASLPAITSNDMATIVLERRLWAEVAVVFWRLASRQQMHLLAYVTTDVIRDLCSLCDGLLDHIRTTFASLGPSASPLQIVDCADSFGAEHIFFLLSNFCSPKSCISMVGGEDTLGKELHSHVCKVLAEQDHLQWMTRLFRAFCDESWRRYLEKSSISETVVSATREVLRCLSHCCATSETCAHLLIYTEPRPLVAQLLYGLRLRISTNTLIRPIVGAGSTWQGGERPASPLSTSAVHVPTRKAELAEYLASGRKNAYDALSREALNAAVVAVKKAVAYDTPDVVVALCHIMEVSSRSIVPPQGGEKKLPMSLQIAMYENVLMAWDALCQLILTRDDAPLRHDIVASQEAVLQQLLNYNPAGCVRCLLQHCPDIVDCDLTLFQTIAMFCTPPSTSSMQHPPSAPAPRTEHSTHRIAASTDSLNESICSRSESVSSLTSSVHLARSALPETTVTRTLNRVRPSRISFWPTTSFVGGVGGHLAHAQTTPCSLAFDDEGYVSPYPQGSSDAVLDYVLSPVFPLSVVDGEEWWYSNKPYVELILGLTQVLNETFTDTTTSPSLRLVICTLLTQISMRSSSAFAASEGRLVLRSFIRALRAYGQHSRRTSTSTHSLPHMEEPNILRRMTIITPEKERGKGSHECMDEDAVYVLLAQRIAAAIWHVYHVLHMIPLSGEMVDLIELPLLSLCWGEEVEPEVVEPEEGAIRTAAGARKTLTFLFAPLARVWYTGLLSNDDEDFNKRSQEVLMEVLLGLLRVGGVLLTAPEVPRVSLTAPASSTSTATSTWNATHSAESSLVSFEAEVPPVEFSDTIKSLRRIFMILLQRDPGFLSFEILEVLFSLLWVNNAQLTELGRKCIASSLDFGEVYPTYTKIIQSADPSLLTKLLPLFAAELLSPEVSTDAKHERRVWLFKHGCVNAVIAVLQRVLLASHNVVCFPRLIQQLFCFLSVSESAQGREPRLADTQLVHVFSESLHCVERVEYLIFIAQAVLGASTSMFDGYQDQRCRVNKHGPFALSVPNCSVEKPVFIDLFPPLLQHAHEHAKSLESDLLSALHLILKMTTKVHSKALLEWVLQRKQTTLLPYLDFDAAAAYNVLPYVGDRGEIEPFWTPILQEAPERAELRFSCTGGIVVTMGRWPEKGFSVSAYFCFEEIYSNIQLFEFFNGEASSPPLASIRIAGGDSVIILHDGKRVSLNESHALPDLAPRRWAHFLVVMSVAHTVSVYLNANKVGTCTLPYFRPYVEVVMHIGFVNAPVYDALFSIGGVVLWDEELTAPQVEAYAATTGYQPNVCKILEREIPRELADNHEMLPVEDRIAVFEPHETRDSMMVNILQKASKNCPIVAKLTGNYAAAPKNWIDYRALFLNQGGMLHLLDWVVQSATSGELERYMALVADCIRNVTNGGTMDFRTYTLLGFHLRRLAHLVTPAVCDSLLHLATANVSVNDELHPFIINRLMFDHIFRDIELFAGMPLDSALYLIERLERLFTVASCRFARRNANYVIPFRFIDSILNGLVYANVSLPFAVRARIILCVKHIMIASDFDPNIVHVLASTAAVLTPGEMEVTSLLQPSLRVKLPKAQFTEIRVSLQGTCDLTPLILRSLVDCCGSSMFVSALGVIVDLNWYAVCVSRFADASCVVYATRLFFEALRSNTGLRNQVMHHPAAVVEALSPHCLNVDLLLLLLSLSVGAEGRIDVLSSKHPLLQQLVGILDSMTPELDTVVAPIFSKVLTLHLTAALSTPACFRPCSLSSVIQRRMCCSYRLRRPFGLARVCSILMIQIYVRRLLSKTTEAGTMASAADRGVPGQSSLKEGGFSSDVTADTTKTPGFLGKHRRALLALRVCVFFWHGLQRRRYKKVLQRMRGTAPLMVLDVDLEKNLFILRTLQSLPLKQGLFLPCTLSPYQIEAFAFFGTFLQRETVLSRCEEKLQSRYFGAVPLTAASYPGMILNMEATGGSDVSAFFSKTCDEWRSSPLTHITGTGEVVMHGVDGTSTAVEAEAEEGEKVNRRQEQHRRQQQRQKGEKEGVTEMKKEEIVKLKHEEESEHHCNMPPTATLPTEHRKRQIRSPLPNSPLHDEKGFSHSPPLLALSVSTDAASLPESMEERAASASDSKLELTMDAGIFSDDDRHVDSRLAGLALSVAGSPLHSELEEAVSSDVAIGTFAPLTNLRSSATRSLQKSAVGVLSHTVLASLLNLPVTEGWVGEQTYGSCGELLFQLMLVAGAMSSTEEVTLTLTYFFIDQLLVCVDLVEGLAEQKPSFMSSLKGSGLELCARRVILLQDSVSDVFVFNVCRLNELFVHLISFDVMKLSSLSSYFVWLLGWASASWPHCSQQLLRSQIVKSCIAVLNRPSLNGITSEQMEIVYMLLSRVFCPKWIMKDMFECLLHVLFRLYTSLPPSTMDEAETQRRKELVVLTLRLMMRTYAGSKELCKALSARALRQRISLYKEFAAALLVPDEATAFTAFEAYCRENMTTIGSVMCCRPKAKADIAYKSMLKDRSEYVKRINKFREAYSKTIEVSDEHRRVRLVQAYTARFSSCVGDISPLKPSQCNWLVTEQCSLQRDSPRVRALHYLDSRGNYTTMISDCVTEDNASMVPSADNCEQQLNHVSALVQPFAIRCRPYLLQSSIPFVDGRCRVSPAAVSLLRYLLEPNEVLRFISNGFRIKGIHATPCLILLTNSTLKLIGFSRITVAGDIVLCQCANEESGEPDFSTTSSVSKSSRAKGGYQLTAQSFAFSMTSKLQRFLTDGAGKERRRRKKEELHDGTKIAYSVRQASGNSYRDLFWVYFLQNISSVRMAYYMHQDTAIVFKFMYADGPMLSLVDAQQSMNTSARDKFLDVLKEVLGRQRCKFHEHSQRAARIRSMLIRWAAGSVSTYDYITFLNRVAGRTRLDFNQYPIYPWVLADYRSSELDLDAAKTYRDLSLPMGAQTEERRQKVMQLYQQMVEMQAADPEVGGVQPFHHGTHYSTSGGVLHFLIRVEPFTTFARIFQGGEFDAAARLFDSVEASFQSCVNGPADCKELMPEFFFDGMFLVNANHCGFGEKSDGTVVNDVKLPPWAKGSTQVFVSVMRYVLESEFVVHNIHRWIDLIFGVRRRGRLAVESYNVFQRMTYGEEVLQALKKCDNPHDTDVIIAEVDNFGQTPMQLFQERHPAQRELEPCHPPSNSGSSGASGANCMANGTVRRSGHTYTTAFQEQLPKVLVMIMHALDSPQTWYTLEDPAPGSFQALPECLSDDILIRESAVIGFATTRSGVKRCCYKYASPVDDMDHLLYWSCSEHMLMRFDSTRGCFLSSLRCNSMSVILKNVSALCVGCRETLILIGSNSGSVHCFGPIRSDGILVLTSTLSHHTHPIAGFALNAKYGRIISFTVSGTDCPVVWCVQHRHTAKLHLLDASRLLSSAAASDLVVVAAVIDPRTANSIVITRRHLLIFDKHGEPYGVGALPGLNETAPHLEDETGQVGFAVGTDTTFIASMTAVTTYDTLEWASGVQLLLTGHDDGSLSLWRAVRLPPSKVKHGCIVSVKYHAIIGAGSQTSRLGAVTALKQEQSDVPVFLVGYASGAVKVLIFGNRTADTTKTVKM
ncbi:putative neurobeachin/beige protein [Trypanosoma rangeli]|uniref:Putative neurobeachin/beige protein n=1 Tax=Trypanosoma rangeli TaxID=5698 RepID=A0A3R7NQ10_TRYRA|nr:putative neurobeachin/beige protein [Trypanosoma rangeli]RNF05917.1 putative neurobeachin/beige protein [Trypanosoma rangeli]|eukprot:RNF05917.1 putative neurobeachin/beige protein [Trypanosoma rangeli]